MSFSFWNFSSGFFLPAPSMTTVFGKLFYNNLVLNENPSDIDILSKDLKKKVKSPKNVFQSCFVHCTFECWRHDGWKWQTAHLHTYSTHTTLFVYVCVSGSGRGTLMVIVSQWWWETPSASSQSKVTYSPWFYKRQTWYSDEHKVHRSVRSCLF